jgi:hypothetical protein
VDIPDTQYARTDDDVYIAHQTVGEGPIDYVWQLVQMEASRPGNPQGGRTCR